MVMIRPNDLGEIAKVGTKWLTAQTFNNVLLFLILGFMGAFTVYTLRYAVPAHLAQIQSGYEAIDNRHVDAVRMSEERSAAAMKQTIDSFREDRAKFQEFLTHLMDKK